MTLKKEIALKVERCEELTIAEIHERCFGFTPNYEQARRFYERFINVNKYLNVRRGCYPMLVSRTKRNRFLQWIMDKMC